MYHIAPSPFTFVDQASILWWRLVITFTRWLDRYLAWAVLVVFPLRRYAWVPLSTLAAGVVIGWTMVFVLATVSRL
jgi:hypothetical protein